MIGLARRSGAVMRSIYPGLLVMCGLTSCMMSAVHDMPAPPTVELSSGSPSSQRGPGPVAPTEEPTAHQEGRASYYSDQLQGQKTATGESYSQNKLTAASPDLPLGAKVTVTNQANGKSVEVKVNDRGPNVDGRVIDLSKSAAKRIGIGNKQGVAPVTVEAKPSRQPTQELKDAVLEKANSPSPE
jgi:rare lipoprotein A